MTDAPRLPRQVRQTDEAVVPASLPPVTGGALRGAAAASRAANGDLPETLGRLGSLEVRLARTAGEIKRAQKLRYHVFYEEMAAIPDLATLITGRDRDRYDEVCDHLLVIDHDLPPTRRGRPRIVGTYRLLRQTVADQTGGFYTESEFDIAPLLAAHPEKRFLELGRSCVLAPWRTRRTVELLWHGIWTYVLHHRIDVLFGCASLTGDDPARLSTALSLLATRSTAGTAWEARARAERHVPMPRALPDDVNPRGALQELPPLLKGYLRLGALIGEGAVVDRQFGTTDVLVILPVERISPRYRGHFGEDADRFAA